MLSPSEIQKGKEYLSQRVPFPLLEKFPVSKAIQENFKDIFSEVNNLIGAKVWSPYFATDTYKGEWDLFWIKGKEGYDKKNCDLCPRTFAILQNFPEVRYASFSALRPKSSLPKHEGIPGVVRIHMGVKSEAGAAGWGCNGERRLCQDGQTVVFEDGFEHEAWTEGTDTRITLMLTVASPDLSPEEAREVFRIHDKKYGFYYVVEKLAKRGGPMAESLFKLVSPAVKKANPLINKFIAGSKPVFLIFMNKISKKKSL